jgi:serine/threonine protein kinase
MEVDTTSAHTCPDCGAGESRPIVLQGWRVGGTLGEGVFGKVTRALAYFAEGDTVRTLDAAVKHMSTRDRAHPSELVTAAAAREVAAHLHAAYTLDHPLAAAVLFSRRQLSVVMPRLAGTLRAALERPVQADHLRVWCHQAVAAVAQWHASGWLVRDAKPDNFLLTDTGDVVLSDVGSTHHATRRRRMSTPIGAEAYAAPEVWQRTPTDTAAYTGAIDVWALGAMFVRMALARRPFDSFSPAELVQRLTKWLPPPPPARRSHRPDDEYVHSLLALAPGVTSEEGWRADLAGVDPRFADLVTQMLRVLPSQRPSAAECLRHPYFAGLDATPPSRHALLHAALRPPPPAAPTRRFAHADTLWSFGHATPTAITAHPPHLLLTAEWRVWVLHLWQIALALKWSPSTVAAVLFAWSAVGASAPPPAALAILSLCSKVNERRALGLSSVASILRLRGVSQADVHEAEVAWLVPTCHAVNHCPWRLPADPSREEHADSMRAEWAWWGLGVLHQLGVPLEGRIPFADVVADAPPRRRALMDWVRTDCRRVASSCRPFLESFGEEARHCRLPPFNLLKR